MNVEIVSFLNAPTEAVNSNESTPVEDLSSLLREAGIPFEIKEKRIPKNEYASHPETQHMEGLKDTPDILVCYYFMTDQGHKNEADGIFTSLIEKYEKGSNQGE